MDARMRTLALTPVLALALMAGGCNKNRQMDIAALEAENQELRDRNDLVEQALNEAEARNAQLSSESAQLRQELAQRVETGTTGFEGSGASISARNTDIVVSVAGDVLFQSGSADLRADAKRTLDSIASTLNSRYSGHRIEIAGHTDTDPMRRTKAKWQDNENLSAQRALAVERYLASRGVDTNRMHISGFGPAMPKGSKKDSRRVEIIVLADGG